MADLREATRCTVHLAVLDGVDVVYVQILNSPGGRRLPSKLGGRLPAHATGVGKAILAYSVPEVVTARIDAGLPRLTPRTISTPGALTRELEQIRSSGVAYDREESTIGIHCVAAPVFDARHRAEQALPLAEPARQAGLPKTSTHRLAEELCRHALLERTELGYRLGMRLF